VWRNAPFVVSQKYSVRHHFVQMADQHPLRHFWYASPQLASTHGPIEQSPQNRFHRPSMTDSIESIGQGEISFLDTGMRFHYRLTLTN
jgi:hypothetical protein